MEEGGVGAPFNTHPREDKITIDERHQQGDGSQDDDSMIHHNVRRDDRPTDSDEYMKDNAEDENDEMSTTPSMVGKTKTKCKDKDRK